MIEKINDCILLMDEVKRNQEASAKNETQKKQNNTFFQAYEKTMRPIMQAYVLSKQFPDFQFSSDIETILKNCLKDTKSAFEKKTVDHATQYRNAVVALNTSMKQFWEQKMSDRDQAILAEMASLRLVYNNPSEIGNYQYLVHNAENWPITEETVDFYMKSIKAVGEIRNSMHLDTTIDEFLTNVSNGTVTLADLTPAIQKWIKTNKLERSFKLSVVQN